MRSIEWDLEDLEDTVQVVIPMMIFLLSLKKKKKSIEWDLEDLEDTVQVVIPMMMTIVKNPHIIFIIIIVIIRLWRRILASSASTQQSWLFAGTLYRQPGRR